VTTQREEQGGGERGDALSAYVRTLVAPEKRKHGCVFTEKKRGQISTKGHNPPQEKQRVLYSDQFEGKSGQCRGI